MGKLGDVLAHPEELLPLIRMYYAAKAATKLPKDEDLAFCYDMLNKVSRSFAVVIQQLPPSLRDAICVFYLVLRGLDTVEDDMAIAKKVKVLALLSFHEKIYIKGFRMSCGTHHYQRLMDRFGTVVAVFLRLEPGYQAVIADITRRMGAGMAEFIEKQAVVSVADYDLYCHYVAGLVGIGLSQLFASSGCEAPALVSTQDLANHMGLFLQKTNIIRDYLEDIMEEPAPRMFWPRAIWGRYGGALDEFKAPGKRADALRCLNHMVCDALRHMPYCIQYMQLVQHPMVFRFCAIPQIMAAGTLALCYNNGGVFEGVVKMRRGETARVFDQCWTHADLYRWFLRYLRALGRKCEAETASDDPTLKQTAAAVAANTAACEKALREWEENSPRPAASGPGQWLLAYALLSAASANAYYAWTGAAAQRSQPLQQAAAVLLLLLVLVALFTRLRL